MYTMYINTVVLKGWVRDVKSGAPLQDEIYQSIRDRILAQEFPVGKQLPTEKELSIALNVSRITVHRALQRLAQQGLIHRYPGKGSFVAEQASGSLQAKNQLVSQTPGTSLIAFVLPGIAEAYGVNVLKAAIDQAEKANYAVMVSFTNDSQESEEVAIRRSVQAGAKGILVNPVYGEFYSEQLLRLHLDNFPLVLVDKRLDKVPVPHVTTNNHTAAYQLTKHLIDLGHRHIGFVSPGVAATATLEDRFAGYLAALDDHQIPYEQRLNLSTLPTGGGVDKPDGPEVYRTIQNYLLEHRDLTAILATEYVFAAIIEHICNGEGMSVPADLSVVCFDSPVPVVETTKFTHILQNQKEIGETAVEMLLRLIDGEKDGADTTVELPAQFVLGQSSKAPKQNGWIGAR